MQPLLPLTRLALVGCLLFGSACADGDGAGASFSLLVDDSPRPVGSVSYDILCEDGALLHDELQVVDEALPNVWGSFVELPAGYCEVALTAFDAAGIPLCTGDVAFDVAIGEVAEPNIVMSCDERQSGPTTVIIEQININICTVVVVGVRNVSQGTGSFQDNSTGDLVLEVTTIGQCSDGGINTDLIAEAIARDPELVEASGSASCEELSCDDGNDCTEEGCVEGLCVVSDKADGTGCEAGLGSCEQGACVVPEPTNPPEEPASAPMNSPSEDSPATP